MSTDLRVCVCLLGEILILNNSNSCMNYKSNSNSNKKKNHNSNNKTVDQKQNCSFDQYFISVAYVNETDDEDKRSSLPLAVVTSCSSRSLAWAHLRIPSSTVFSAINRKIFTVLQARTHTHTHTYTHTPSPTHTYMNTNTYAWEYSLSQIKCSSPWHSYARDLCVCMWVWVGGCESAL